jgi:hypothetical protein
VSGTSGLASINTMQSILAGRQYRQAGRRGCIMYIYIYIYVCVHTGYNIACSCPSYKISLREREERDGIICRQPSVRQQVLVEIAKMTILLLETLQTTPYYTHARAIERVQQLYNIVDVYIII